jgi:hypothetical protein
MVWHQTFKRNWCLGTSESHSGLLAILSKSIAIIYSDTAEKSIADSDSDTSKVSPILSLSIIDINNPGHIDYYQRDCRWENDSVKLEFSHVNK